MDLVPSKLVCGSIHGTFLLFGAQVYLACSSVVQHTVHVMYLYVPWST